MNYLHLLTGKYRALDSRTRLHLGIAIAIALGLAVLLSAANDQINKLGKKRAAREADIAEMLSLKLRYREASAGAQKLANRLTATRPDDSPAKLIEEIGIKGKNTQIKPVKGDDLPGYVEDAAEVRIEGLSANEAMNLIYRLEKGARPVTIKRALLKTRYDDPAKLDLTMTIALIKPATSGQK
jgi:general secretion pathway protein M